MPKGNGNASATRTARRNAMTPRRTQGDDPYRLLLEMTSEAVLLGVEGRVALANGAAALLFGAAAADELVGLPLAACGEKNRAGDESLRNFKAQTQQRLGQSTPTPVPVVTAAPSAAPAKGAIAAATAAPKAVVTEEQIAITISVSLLASWLVAVSLIPMISARLKTPATVSRENLAKGLIPRLQTRYARLLRWTLEHRGKSVLGIILIIAISVVPMMLTKKNMFGGDGGEQVGINYQWKGSYTKEQMMVLNHS
jgi:hypothetical protein